MSLFLTIVAIVLFVNMLLGLIRVHKGPTLENQLVAAQMIGTTVTTILLVLAVKQDMSSLIDAALLIAIISSVTLMAFVSPSWKPSARVRPKEEASRGPD